MIVIRNIIICLLFITFFVQTSSLFAEQNSENKLEIIDFSWAKEEFYNKVFCDFTIINNSEKNINKFIVNIKFFDKNEKLLIEKNEKIKSFVKAGGKKNIRQHEIGFVPDGVASFTVWASVP
jgi:hypothetical protein